MTTDKELVELKSSLKQHRTLLTQLLNTPSILESDVYLLIAAQLRVLLCDIQNPILIQYSKRTSQDLYIYGPKKLPSQLLKSIIFNINFKVASYYPIGPMGKKYSINDYLDLPIGHLALSKNSNSILPNDYSMKQLIKWVANKEGICHLDFRKPSTFQQLKKIKISADDKIIDDGLIRSSILKMADWVLKAILELLLTCPL